METYKATFKMRSASATPWQADTVFGQLCWILKYLDGEGALEELLESYRADAPAFIISNGFPDDLLPRPVRTAGGQEAGADDLVQRVQAARLAKDAATVNYLTLDEFNTMRSGVSCQVSHKMLASERITLKNQINRLTGTTGGEGGELYEFHELPWQQVSLYVKIGTYTAGEVRRLFEAFAEVGHGRRRTVGYGEIESLEFEPFTGFEPAPNANGFLSLSNFTPAREDPTRGFWRAFVKYGKLGEEYAVEGAPFKRPLLMLEAGSCFYDANLQSYYGRLVDGVSPSHPEVVQYGLAFAVPMRLPYPHPTPGSPQEAALHSRV